MIIPLPSTINQDPKKSAQHVLEVAARMGRTVYMLVTEKKGTKVFGAQLNKPDEGTSYLEVKPTGECEAVGGFAIFDYGEKETKVH